MPCSTCSARRLALACATPPPEGAKRWALPLVEQAPRPQPGMEQISRETIRRLLKNCLKPWSKMMWCVGALSAEYRSARQIYGALRRFTGHRACELRVLESTGAVQALLAQDNAITPIIQPVHLARRPQRVTVRELKA